MCDTESSRRACILREKEREVIQFPYTIPVGELGRGSKLYTDYVSGTETRAHELLGGYRRSRPVWDEALRAPDHSSLAESDTWQKLVDQLIVYNSSLGANEEVLDKLEQIRNGQARFVVTGQQPGALGGSLLTLYKISTAIALAEHVERTYGIPCLPLFWMGADDADFQEIRDLFIVDCDLSPLLTSIDNSAWKTASPVGDLPVEAVRQLWKAVEPIVGKCPYGSRVSALVYDALEGASDHGEVTARVLSALVGGRIAVVDGREPLIRKHASDVYLRFFDNEAGLQNTVAETGDLLEAAGYHAQLKTGPDSGVFRVEDGRRKKIVDGLREETRKQMEADITGFSPGVALRNLVQDSVFRPVAVVLGPAEIAYRAQLDGLYQMMQVPRPVAFPRMPGTWLSPAVVQLVQSLDRPDMVQLLTNTPVFVKSVYESERLTGGEDAATRFKRSFSRESHEFLSAIAETLDARTAEKARKKLDDVARRLDRALEVAGEAGKKAALANWPFLEGLGEFVFRNTRAQDRYLSCLTPYLFAGEKAAAAVASAAVTFVDGALDGRTPHVVYCV
jgi:hypothetical protein